MEKSQKVNINFYFGKLFLSLRVFNMGVKIAAAFIDFSDFQVIIV